MASGKSIGEFLIKTPQQVKIIPKENLKTQSTWEKYTVKNILKNILKYIVTSSLLNQQCLVKGLIWIAFFSEYKLTQDLCFWDYNWLEAPRNLPVPEQPYPG